MVDFSKRLRKKVTEKKIDPFEIYKSLDRRSITGPLRPIQETILRKWYNERKNDKDLIIKLHTGSGKTLIGLLILQSRINENSEPCLYLTPNKYLSKQVCIEADKFGIPYCQVDENNEIPNSFLDGKKILVTTVQKLFNGRTKFGLDKNTIGCDSIIIDDSHACIDYLKNAFAINVNSNHPLYKDIIHLFEDDLKNQGYGTFLEIKEGNYDSQLLVPYWSLFEKEREVLEKLSEYKEHEELTFAWPLIKDSLKNMQLLVSGNSLELSPYYIPIDKFGTFNDANQRILMSATTQNDSFFIKGLGFSKESVLNTLEDHRNLWSGEKMLLIPSLIDEELDRILIINEIARPNPKRKFGVVVLAPSFKVARDYETFDAIVASTSNIFELVQNLKKGSFEKTLVLPNRYDGIDLPDEACRILIMDSKPFFDSLLDRYEESCRKDSDIINIKLAQKVEQGLGRSVRGEKDFSAILLIGNDLVKFLRSSKTKKYFSNQTRKQIEIGLEVANMAKEDLNEESNSFEVIKDLMKQIILKRDEGWKEFYGEKMSETEEEYKDFSIYEILEKERRAEEFFYIGEIEKAASVFQDIIDNNCILLDEKGWYLQQLARVTYLNSKVESNKIQKSAFLNNKQLLKPKEGISYKKVSFIDDNRIQNIFKWVKQYDSFDDMLISIDGIFSELTFGMPSEKFEAALSNLGEMLGFISERPDKEYNVGPDNLWCGTNNYYIIFECKSEVKNDRKAISKYEASQMNSHCAWFEETYGQEKVKRILVIPTRLLSRDAFFTHQVEIMKKNKLKNLKSNVRSFFREFKDYDLGSIDAKTVNGFLSEHHLDMSSIFNSYSEEYRRSS